MTGDDFKAAVGILAQKAGPDPRKWETTGLKRDATSGRFNDDDLTRVLTEATDEVAGAFGAKHVPSIMRIIDMMGINSSRRDWAVCTLKWALSHFSPSDVPPSHTDSFRSEFRRFLHLKPFESFEEWNSDPEVAATARHLYTHPDNLELFAGLHAEEAKPSQSGSGLAVGCVRCLP